jgi:guanylate kinase
MNLEDNITQYHPTDEAIAIVKQAKIVLLVGITGAGKDTIKGKLLQRDSFQDIVSHTTRAPRANNGIDEIDGIDYHFMNDDTANRMVQESAFIEVKLVHGTVYGTSVEEVKRAHDAGKVAITDIDVQGVTEYKAISSGVIAIFILPPSYDAWIERMSKRYASQEELDAAFPARRASAITELRHALEVSYYHFIINDDLDRAVQVADEIAHQPDVFHRKDDEARLAARDLLDAIEARS